MSNEETIFGIDLGLTSAYIAYVDGPGSPVVIKNIENEYATPAIVELGGQWTTAGAVAKRKAPVPPSAIITMASRWLGEDQWTVEAAGSAYSAVQIVAFILQKLVNDARIHTGHDIKRAVLTCPASFTSHERDALRDAARLAGLDVAGLLSAPAAAAIGYTMMTASEQPSDQTALVYDLGGASFTATALAFRAGAVTLIRMDGDTRLGGRVWDEQVAQYLAGQWMAETGRYTDNPLDSPEGSHDLTLRAEEARHALNQRASTEVAVNHQGRAVVVRLTRERFNELAMPLLDETIIRVRHTLDATSMTSYGAVNTLLLAGGAARTPLVADQLRAAFPIEIRCSEPDLVAARGAAIYGRRLAQDQPVVIREDPGFAAGRAPRSSIPRNRPEPPEPRRIFISYKSEDRLIVEEMAERLEQDGHTVWYDQRLVGGQAWWREILLHIRESDVFVFALTPLAMDSAPCQMEYQYASAVNRHILPVRMTEDVNPKLLPTDLQAIHAVDYHAQDAHEKLREALRLVARNPPLPLPLPDEPATPVSPLGELRSRLDAPTLSRGDQYDIFSHLRTLRKRPNTAIDAKELLEKLRNHPDALATVADDIRALLGE